MPEPVVSVIIPCYNRLALLKETIASVQAQTFDAWELIVADDGSTEPVSDYVESLADPRIHAARLEHVGIMGAVRNAGAARTRAPYLAFLDSDDLWKPQKLERQMAALRQSGAPWSFTGFEVIDTAGRPAQPGPSSVYRPYRGDLLTGILTTEAAVPIVSLVVERALFEQVGRFDGSATLWGRDDYDLALKLAIAAQPAIVLEPLVSIRHHGNRANALDLDPHLRVTPVYRHFIERGAPPRYLALARRMLAHHYTSSAYLNARNGRPGVAAQRLLAGAWPGMLTPRWWRTWLRVAAARRKKPV
jgi:glycosyltransferase involved in cell wall biosynthesis